MSLLQTTALIAGMKNVNLDVDVADRPSALSRFLVLLVIFGLNRTPKTNFSRYTLDKRLTKIARLPQSGFHFSCFGKSRMFGIQICISIADLGGSYSGFASYWFFGFLLSILTFHFQM